MLPSRPPRPPRPERRSAPSRSPRAVFWRIASQPSHRRRAADPAPGLQSACGLSQAQGRRSYSGCVSLWKICTGKGKQVVAATCLDLVPSDVTALVIVAIKAGVQACTSARWHGGRQKRPEDRSQFHKRPFSPDPAVVPDRRDCFTCDPGRDRRLFHDRAPVFAPAPVLVPAGRPYLAVPAPGHATREPAAGAER